mmetsp:Transcript_10274/g.15636  ORF Transcript_10274/g.15636 Transcript_10274/m.15636 type:complete len:161 (+) Transcript_10274:1620-2102(+)
MDLDEMICRSICTIECQDLRNRLANAIILVGGPSKSHKMIEMVEEAVISRMKSMYDETIERVEVVLCNIQQLAAHLLAQQQQNQSEEEPYLKFKTDPRVLSWIGGSVLPKLESSKDMFVPRDKFLVAYKNYETQFQEMKEKQVNGFLAQQKINAEAKEKQ